MEIIFVLMVALSLLFSNASGGWNKLGHATNLSLEQSSNVTCLGLARSEADPILHNKRHTER